MSPMRRAVTGGTGWNVASVRFGVHIAADMGTMRRALERRRKITDDKKKEEAM